MYDNRDDDDVQSLADECLKRGLILDFRYWSENEVAIELTGSLAIREFSEDGAYGFLLGILDSAS